MPPRHRKGIADAVNPPEPMIPGNRAPRKTCSVGPASAGRLGLHQLAVIGPPQGDVVEGAELPLGDGPAMLPVVAAETT